MLQSKPLNEITIADVRAFINEGHRESEILDYKGPWPSDLAKVIAAMANTQGGLILIGVPELPGSTGLPEQPTGVPIGRGLDTLRQKAISIAYDSIYPPVRPEVEAYDMDNKPDHAVIAIRVSPSDQTPHAVDNRTKVYVRVDSQSKPELYQLATIDQLQWLYDKRKKGEAFLEDLIEAAQARADSVLSIGFDPMVDLVQNTIPTLDIWIAPRFYFDVEVFSRDQAQWILSKESSRSTLLNENWDFPGLASRAWEKRSIAGGYCLYTSERYQRDSGMYEYDELNITGIIFSKIRLNITHPDYEGHVLWLPSVLAHLDSFIKFSDSSLKKSQLWGLLCVKAKLSGLDNTVLRLNRNDWIGSLREKHISLDHSIDLFDKNVDLSSLEENRLLLVKEAANKLLWAFGYAWTEDAFKKWWDGIKK